MGELGTKKIKTEDGTIVHYIELDGKKMMHNWDGPAYIPKGNKRASEYWLFSFKYTKDQWGDRKKDINGQPWYKTAAGKAAGARV
jgi:hypothetical protein